MAQVKKSENVPKAMLEKYTAIVEITDNFSAEYLTEEYAQLIRYGIAALCRKRPSPLMRGKVNSWACGITHAMGMVNFLFDSSQSPYMKASYLYEIFQIGSSTGQGKSKEIRDILKMYPMDPNWSLPSRMDTNPMAWMISVDGFILDVRYVSRDIQVAAFEKGLIPYIPDDNLTTME